MNYLIRPGLANYKLGFGYIEYIIKKNTGFDMDDLRKKSGKREIVDARKLFALFAFNSGKSYCEIMKHFGIEFCKHDAIIRYYVKKCKETPDLQKKYENLKY